MCAYGGLGLDQHLGSVEATFTLARARAFPRRLQQLGRLALPWRSQRQALAAGGVRAAMYGAAMAALPDMSLRKMRKQVTRALLRARVRAARLETV